MKKILIMILILLTVIFTACSTESNNDILLNNETNFSIIDANTEVHVEPEQGNGVIVGNENVTLSFENETAVADVNSEVVVEFQTAQFSEWCIPGEIFSENTDEMDIEAIIIGVTTYNGVDVCAAEQIMNINTPMGDFTVEIRYYISENSDQIWVITNSMGEITETFVDLR